MNSKQSFQHLQRYIYLLFAAIFITFVFFMVFYYWQDQKNKIAEEILNNFHSPTIFHSSRMKEELFLLEKELRLLQQPGMDKKKLPGYIFKPKGHLYSIQKSLQTIIEAQEIFKHIEFESILKRLQKQFNQLQAFLEDQKLGKDKLYKAIESKVPSLNIPLDQLQRLHIAKHKELIRRLLIQKKGRKQNTVFVFGVTLAIGIFIFVRIFSSIKQIINEKKQSEKKLKDYAVKLERSNKELQDFAHIASHDLQEPLRKIITFGDRLNSKISNTDEQGRDYLKRMQNSALRMKEFIQDLVQFTKIESQAKPFETVDLKEVVQEVLDNLEVRIQETKGVVNIKYLPVVEADRMQMNQLFLNLIGNALKFHREGISPVVNLDSAKKENGFLEITVEDNGVGIEENHVDKIFKPFERLHGRSTYEGTGIGLTICARIIERHGGKIAVKRQSKNGVTFHITLPENNEKK